MENNQVIETLKEMIRCWDMCNDPDSAIHKEIGMWRNKFLDESYASDEDRDLFNAIPSSFFIEVSPAINLKNVKITITSNK